MPCLHRLFCIFTLLLIYSSLESYLSPNLLHMRVENELGPYFKLSLIERLCSKRESEHDKIS